MKRIDKVLIILIIFLLLTIVLLFLYTSIKKSDSSPCILEEMFSEYVKGEIIIDFVQDVKKEEVEELLSYFGFSSKDIKYPEKNEYRVDFTGNAEGFLDYLENFNFYQEESPRKNLFIIVGPENMTCKKANEIFYSYKGVSISYIYCFGHVWGTINVKSGTERYWMCKLRKNEIVENTHLNGISHISKNMAVFNGQG